jgi:hypothetical protein
MVTFSISDKWVCKLCLWESWQKNKPPVNFLTNFLLWWVLSYKTGSATGSQIYSDAAEFAGNVKPFLYRALRTDTTTFSSFFHFFFTEETWPIQVFRDELKRSIQTYIWYYRSAEGLASRWIRLSAEIADISRQSADSCMLLKQIETGRAQLRWVYQSAERSRKGDYISTVLALVFVSDSPAVQIMFIN